VVIDFYVIFSVQCAGRTGHSSFRNAFGISSTLWAKTFKMYLLTMDNETLFQVFNERDGYSDHTVCRTTAYTGKMRMALCIGTSVGKLKMLRSFMNKRPMHQSCSDHTL
jgi:hypothetical protein